MKTATLRSTATLIEHGFASPDRHAALEQVAARYAVAIPAALADLIDRSEPADPIGLQFVPNEKELAFQPHEHNDPIGDDAHSPVQGIVHRYPDRVLLKLVNVCAVYCRFCFRREMIGPGRPATLAKPALDAALGYIRSHREIWEVILTGGDPLMLSPRRLRAVMRALAKIEHVKVVRIHTRLPVAAPERMTPQLVQAMTLKSKAVYVGLHVNHARELTAAARKACARIVNAGIPMVSQTVLLAGVNDDARSLESLMRALVECRIKPYYLHHGDLAPGTSHLRTDISTGQQLMRSLHGRLSGLCQPAYVLDIPGGYGKSPIGPNYIERIDGGSSHRVTDFTGRQHRYPASQKLVADRYKVEQGGRQRQADKADKHDGDHRVPNE